MLLVFVAIPERIKWRIYERTKGKKQKTYISIRLNIMFLCIFVLFSAIIMQLGKVQIVEEEAYKNQVESSQNAITSIPVPRGQILDREGKQLLIINLFAQLRIQG